MCNYDFKLDMETDNSNSLILRNISPGSTVLEMGSAYGRMTKYLKEQLNCLVYIVELDEDAGAVASQYAAHSWIGKMAGDITSRQWHTELQQMGLKFDYIIFADVLEHLVDPQSALQLAVELLKPNGSIFISVPNISHNSVIIDLLQDKFDYRDVGILDKTHLKFFTYNSLKTFIASCGLVISEEMNTTNKVEHTEFDNNYNQVPAEVSAFLSQRKYGETYQFVWRLKRTGKELSIVIPVFNKWLFTKSCLDDLSKLDPSRVEIIVVNNGSTDETKESLQTYETKCSNLKVIHNAENQGFGKAVGLGFEQASGLHIMCLNNDIRVKNNFEDWVQVVIDKCTDNNLVGPTGGKVDPNNGFQFLYETNDPARDINYLSGWCITAKKEVWEKLIQLNDGFLFDPSLFCYFEDTDLGFRAQRAGIEFTMITVPVVHFGKISSKQLNTHKLYSKSREIFLAKWTQK